MDKGRPHLLLIDQIEDRFQMINMAVHPVGEQPDEVDMPPERSLCSASQDEFSKNALFDGAGDTGEILHDNPPAPQVGAHLRLPIYCGSSPPLSRGSEQAVTKIPGE